MAKIKRLKMIYAGRLTLGLVYIPPRPRDKEHIRQARQRTSSAGRKALNLKASCRRLELLLAANFEKGDAVITLTYDQQNLPPNKKEAVKRVKKLLARLRQSKKAQGQTLRYIYVTEGAHSGGRLHHHMVLGGGQQDLQLLQSLWPGHLHVESLETYGGYEPLVMYLTKEPREQGRPKPGERMWSASRNLTKPKETNQWMDG